MSLIPEFVPVKSGAWKRWPRKRGYFQNKSRCIMFVDVPIPRYSQVQCCQVWAVAMILMGCEKVSGIQVLQQSRERWGICATKAAETLVTLVEPREATHTYNGWLLTVTWARQSSTIWRTRNSSGGFWMFWTMRNPSKNTLPNTMLLDHQGYLEDPKVNFQGVSGIHGISDAARASECRLLPDKVSGVTTATTCHRYLGNLDITCKEARYDIL